MNGKGKLNKHEYFVADGVVRREVMEKKYAPEVVYYQEKENEKFKVCVVIRTPFEDIKNPMVLDNIKKGKIELDNGVYTYHNSVAYAKRENLARQKTEDVNRLVSFWENKLNKVQ